MKAVVPPIKCQGIKTKLVPYIAALAGDSVRGRWVEPFCGSGVVGLSLQPKTSLLCDTNVHLVGFYRAIQTGEVTVGGVREYLQREGRELAEKGQAHYYFIRDRFNAEPNPWDFLFLSRAAFNGVMRFNGKGRFNVPFCHKPERFSRAYVTKIANQVRAVSAVVSALDWEFRVADYRETLRNARPDDFVYADPPYGGRHTDYYNAWDDTADADLLAALKSLPCRFILSTWHHNRYRHNPLIQRVEEEGEWHIELVEHFYHVGPTEDLRAPMVEALVCNYRPAAVLETGTARALAQLAFLT